MWTRTAATVATMIRSTPLAQNAHPFFPWLTAPRRAYLYRVSLALLPILVAVGVVTEAGAAIVAALVVALLDLSVAALHTPRER